jgi:hypothetical protein
LEGKAFKLNNKISALIMPRLTVLADYYYPRSSRVIPSNSIFVSQDCSEKVNQSSASLH